MSLHHTLLQYLFAISIAIPNPGYAGDLPSRTTPTSVLSASAIIRTTSSDFPPFALPTAIPDLISPNNDPCNTPGYGMFGVESCPYDWSCAYDPSLSVLGCAMSTGIHGYPTFHHSMYTACHPFNTVQYFSSAQSSTVCDVSCEYSHLVMSCGPTITNGETITGYNFCATKHLLVGSLNLTQLYCATTTTEYHTTLSVPSTSPTPLSQIDLLRSLTLTSTPTGNEYTGSAQSNGKWITIISVSGVVLLILIVSGVWLYRTRPRVYSNHELKRIGIDDDPGLATKVASRHLSYQEKLGTFGILSVFGPVPLIGASLGILFTFWVTPTQPGNDTLRSWIIGNKLPTIIAICSLVIRFALATQTALAISMMASIALENHFVGILDIPTLLIQRSNNGVSFDLPILFMRNIFSTPRLRLVGVLIPLWLLTLLSLALQFTSTILFTDLGSDHVPTTSSTIPVPLGFDNTSPHVRGGDNNPIDFSASPPVAYPPFAEHVPIPSRYELSKGLGYTKRAFLPLSSQDMRQSIRNFTGFATIIDVSTKCVRPIFKEFSLQPSNDPTFITLNATVDAIKSYLGQGPNDYGSLFDDRFLPEGSPNQFSQVITNQKVESVLLHCTIYLDPLRLLQPGPEAISYMCSYGGVRAFAFVNLLSPNVTASQNVTELQDWWMIDSISNVTVVDQTPWTILKYTQNDYAWQITLCSTIIEPQYRSINAWSDSTVVEKILVTDNETRALNSTNLLLWLGTATGELTLQERSVLAFNILPGQTWGEPFGSSQPRIGSIPMSRPLGGHPLGRYYSDANMTYHLCENCPLKYNANFSYFHPVHTKIIQDILTSTGEPALALQAFWTLVYQSYYYDNLPFFNVFSNSTCVFWAPVLVPITWHGIAAVCCMVGAHLILFFGILVFFLRRTKFSRVHDPWLAYTQAYTGALADLLDEMHTRQLRDPKILSTSETRAHESVSLDLDILGRAVGVRRRQKKLMSDTDSSHDSD